MPRARRVGQSDQRSRSAKCGPHSTQNTNSEWMRMNEQTSEREGRRRGTWIFFFLTSASERFPRSAVIRNLRFRFLTIVTADLHRLRASWEEFLAWTSKFSLRYLSIWSMTTTTNWTRISRRENGEIQRKERRRRTIWYGLGGKRSGMIQHRRLRRQV